MLEEARRILRDTGFEAQGWVVESESVLTCPHGHRIEWDGDCPDGCKSPFLVLELI